MEKANVECLSTCLESSWVETAYLENLPVAQMTPPIIANGWNFGDFIIMSPTIAMIQMAAHVTH